MTAVNPSDSISMANSKSSILIEMAFPHSQYHLIQLHSFKSCLLRHDDFDLI